MYFSPGALVRRKASRKGEKSDFHELVHGPENIARDAAQRAPGRASKQRHDEGEAQEVKRSIESGQSEGDDKGQAGRDEQLTIGDVLEEGLAESALLAGVGAFVRGERHGVAGQGRHEEKGRPTRLQDEGVESGNLEEESEEERQGSESPGAAILHDLEAPLPRVSSPDAVDEVRDLAGFTNQRVAEASRSVTLVVAGLPLRLK